MYGLNWDKDAPAPATQEQCYQVGDRVRVVKEGGDKGGSYHGADIGEKFTVTDDAEDDGLLRADGGLTYWYFYPHEIAPAFRPGDRVRLNKHHGLRTYGDRGTVSSVLGDSVSARMDEPSMYGSVVAVFPDSVLDWERVEDVKAADCAGRKEQQYKIELPPADVESVFINGTLYTADAKPKFKAGDWVRAKEDDALGEFRAGDLFTITTVDGDFIEFDDNNGDERYQPAENFELAAPCPQDNEQPRNVETLTLKLELDTSGFTDALDAALGSNRPCIVALTKNGQPRPSTYPHVHLSVQAATTEAERLARINPGQEFAVYQRVAGRVAEVQMKEVA